MRALAAHQTSESFCSQSERPRRHIDPSCAAGYLEDLREAAARTVRLSDEPVVPRAATAELYDDAHRAHRRLFDGIERALS
jgi:hypothetical protein